MKPISTFRVKPLLPETLRPLLGIANNLRWSWDHAVLELFRRLDRDLWEECNHNPLLLLGKVDQNILESAARDESFLAHLKGVDEHLNTYLRADGTWYRRKYPESKNLLVAYFSAEFGITECLSIFAGGLGVLAGDHLKASSDLGLPLVGVGLLYQQGYFRQYLNAAGWQQEAMEDNDFHTLPIELLPNVTVRVELPNGNAAAQVWKANVGRLQLYLLDANIPENRPEDRRITYQLYGGDKEMRIKQEILLGIGGYRTLEALGIQPTVYHMNEGHSAFLGLERILRLMETRHLSFREARLLASASLVFTTHTPVGAGHDYFPLGLVDHYFSECRRRLGISSPEFLALGKQDPRNDSEEFCMTILALRLASARNAVSELHGVVSRQMWNRIWPGLPEKEIPIGHVTNGVHYRSWVSNEMNQLYDRYLGPKWREEPADVRLWHRVQSIPAVELWRTHERRRERLVAYARRQLRAQLAARSASSSEISEADEVLSPDALTIGFGRRFATYKRATLLLRDPQRLEKLLNHSERPVQVIYSGKAHPHDDAGKHFIQAIIELAKRPEFRKKLVFLENYGMATARYMVQGCDIWLNTPLRPMEASGTSGMKAQANGVLNVSTLDGWWDEAWRMAGGSQGDIGWSIGNAETYSDPALQDQVEAEALYGLLEREIVPLFYHRKADGLPVDWVGKMKISMGRLCSQFNMQRAVMQYADEYYSLAHHRYDSLSAEDSAQTKYLAAWLKRVEDAWSGVCVEEVQETESEVDLGAEMDISARVHLAPLAPDDVTVQVLAGRVNANGEITEPSMTPMAALDGSDGGSFVFKATLRPASQSGLHGYAIRVVPKAQEAMGASLPGLVTWADRLAPVHA